MTSYARGLCRVACYPLSLCSVGASLAEVNRTGLIPESNSLSENNFAAGSTSIV